MNFTQKTQKNLTQLMLVLSSVFMLNQLSAQVRNNGTLTVLDNSVFHVAYPTFSFGGSHSTVTTKTTTTYGKISLGATSTITHAVPTDFVDGYVRGRSAAVTYRIGGSGVYAPIEVSSRVGSFTDAAYFNSAFSNVTSLGPNVGSVTDDLYWNVFGGSGRLTLSWASSISVAPLSADLSNVSIVGWNGIQWLEIPSTVVNSIITGSPSTVDGGSIISNASVNFLSGFQFFTLGRVDPCAVNLIPSGNTVTWNGSAWSPAAPTELDAAVINGAYNGPSFACYSLEVNAAVTLADGVFIDVYEDITGSGLITLSSKASLRQRVDGGTSPTISLTKVAEDKVKNDYIYWGSPVNTNVVPALDNATAAAVSVGILPSITRWVYNSGPVSGGWSSLGANFNTPGRGFITRVDGSPFVTSTTQADVQVTFPEGTANNGVITVPVTNNPNSLAGGTSHYLFGNPYPSAIDAAEFIRQNPILDGVVYVWTSANSNVLGINYTQDNYSAFTLVGSVTQAPPAVISLTFDGKIPTGQGFKVRVLPSGTLGVANTGNVEFNNCMRVTGDNNTFYRSPYVTESTETKNKFKLALTNNTGIYNEILIGYFPECTMGYDRMYDATMNSVSTTRFSSLLDGTNTRLSINARPEFSLNDKVDLGINKNAVGLETYTISKHSEEGIFANNQIVYLHDKLLGYYHNLNEGDYTFQIANTNNDGRFEVVYLNETLSVVGQDLVKVVAFIDNATFMAQANQTIDKVVIYDMLGRAVEHIRGNNSNIIQSSFRHANGAYVSHCYLNDGTVAVIKLINQ